MTTLRAHVLLAATVVWVAILSCTTQVESDDAALVSARATADAAVAALEAQESRTDVAGTRTAEFENVRSEIVDAETRLEMVLERGRLVCATRNDIPGWGAIDAEGNPVGFDIDTCRAVAAAVLGDSEAFEIRYITASERGPALQSGNIDLLVRSATWTTSRDAAWGNYTITMFYDGQGFMVPKSLGVKSAYELSGAAVCVTAGTTTELNMADFFRQNEFRYDPQVFEETDTALEAYDAEQCDVVTSNTSLLAGLRAALSNPDEHIVLPETISDEPSTPVVPHGDDQWLDIVKAVLAGVIHAEALGIDSTNVDEHVSNGNVTAKRLLGVEGGFGQERLGLSTTFMQDVLKQVGNYGEIYARNFLTDSINIPRVGRNRLWIDGGQIFAPPLR